MATLSAVIITHNEESRIVDCLASVSFADEIIVIDSFSTDQTAALAKNVTDRVLLRAWPGYAAQKNHGFELAHGDWILSLDADERITPNLAREIQDLLGDPPDDVHGYFLVRKNFYRGQWMKHGGMYPDWVLRLFRRSHGSCPDRAVHEAIEVQGPTRRLKHPLDHHSYNSVADFIDRMQRYSALSAQDYSHQGRTTGPVRMSARAAYAFFSTYFVRGGFLDGYNGFLLAGLFSMLTWIKYAKLKEQSEDA